MHDGVHGCLVSFGLDDSGAFNAFLGADTSALADNPRITHIKRPLFVFGKPHSLAAAHAMNTTRLFRVSLVWLALSVSALAADSLKRGFVRERGTYPLDDSRGALEFLTATNGRLSWRLSWRHEGSMVSLSMPDEGFFRGPGWFVFIESSSRIWLYDGESQLDLVHRTERGIGRNSVVAVFDSCPKEVWTALPETVRKKLNEKRKA